MLVDKKKVVGTSVTSVTLAATAHSEPYVVNKQRPGEHEKATRDGLMPTPSLPAQALREELRKRDEATRAFEVAQDEFIRLLDKGDAPLCELADTLSRAVRCLKKLKYQRGVVEWCRSWAKQQREEATAFQPTVERLRGVYGETVATPDGLREPEHVPVQREEECI